MSTMVMSFERSFINQSLLYIYHKQCKLIDGSIFKLECNRKQI